MTKTEGEYELVLGNRQLLSAFFIIVILFGVFFTMGYVVGRNSAPTTAASSVATTPAGSVKTEAVPPAAVQPSTPTATPPAETAKEPAPVETKPVAPEVTPEKTAAAPPQEKPAAAPPVKHSAPAAKKAPDKPVEKAPAKPAESSAGAPVITPGPGRMYLQVVAVGQPQAGAVVDTLKGKGFPAHLAQGPNGALFRVLVGPYADTAALGKAKAELESAGFKPYVRK